MHNAEGSLHEVTRRIINRPVISKAAESELLMAFKVAEDLQVRIIEVVTASVRTAHNPAVGDPGQLVHGTGFIDAQLAVQCCFAQRRASRFDAEGASAFVAVAVVSIADANSICDGRTGAAAAELSNVVLNAIQKRKKFADGFGGHVFRKVLWSPEETVHFCGPGLLP